MSQLQKAKSHYIHQSFWNLPPNCGKLIAVEVDGKRVKYRESKGFEIIDEIPLDAEEIEVFYEYYDAIKSKSKSRKKTR